MRDNQEELSKELEKEKNKPPKEIEKLSDKCLECNVNMTATEIQEKLLEQYSEREKALDQKDSQLYRIAEKHEKLFKKHEDWQKSTRFWEVLLVTYSFILTVFKAFTSKPFIHDLQAFYSDLFDFYSIELVNKLKGIVSNFGMQQNVKDFIVIIVTGAMVLFLLGVIVWYAGIIKKAYKSAKIDIKRGYYFEGYNFKFYSVECGALFLFGIIVWGADVLHQLPVNIIVLYLIAYSVYLYGLKLKGIINFK